MLDAVEKVLCSGCGVQVLDSAVDEEGRCSDCQAGLGVGQVWPDAALTQRIFEVLREVWTPTLGLDTAHERAANITGGLGWLRNLDEARVYVVRSLHVANRSGGYQDSASRLGHPVLEREAWRGLLALVELGVTFPLTACRA